MSDEKESRARWIARQILAQQVPCKEHPVPLPKPSCWQCGRNGAFHRAALIALGEFPEPLSSGEAERGEYCNICENFPCLGNHPAAQSGQEASEER